MRLVYSTERGEGALSGEVLALAAQRLIDDHSRRVSGQSFVKGLQDSWLSTYLLIDRQQDAQPPFRERYYTSRPASIIDTARRLLSQHPLRFRVASQFASQADVKSTVAMQRQAFENVLHGVMYDIDRQLVNRGELQARAQAAFHIVNRGAWAYRYQLSSKAKTSTGSPQDYRQLDPRLVYPRFDLMGLESATYTYTTDLSALLVDYPEVMQPIVDHVRRVHEAKTASPVLRTQSQTYMYDPVTVVEFSSREESGVLVDFSNIPAVRDRLKSNSAFERDSTRSWCWVQEPMNHGFGRSLIQYGNANGIPVGSGTPAQAESFLKDSRIFHDLRDNNGTIIHHSAIVHSPGGTAGADSRVMDTGMGLVGRSIIAMVQHQFPEYNKIASMLKDAVIREIRGTWVLKTPNGQAVEVEIGTGKVNYLSTRDGLEKVDPNVQPPDMMAMMQMVNQEISDGSIDLRFILASEQDSSGVTRARMEEAALIAIADYRLAQEQWAVSVADSFVAQYRKAPNEFKDWTVVSQAPGSMTKFFKLDVKDQIAEMLKTSEEPPIIEAKVKVAQPIDMMARINTAKSAIDPNNPVMGLAMALDTIMQVDDVEAVYDMIFQDMGNRNPTIILMRMAQAFKEAGAPEMAEMLLETEFKAAFEQQMQSMQGGTKTPAGSSPGINPGTMPPELTSGGGTEVNGATPTFA
jgi:hypothetical protein